MIQEEFLEKLASVIKQYEQEHGFEIACVIYITDDPNGQNVDKFSWNGEKMEERIDP